MVDALIGVIVYTGLMLGWLVLVFFVLWIMAGVYVVALDLNSERDKKKQGEQDEADEEEWL